MKRCRPLFLMLLASFATPGPLSGAPTAEALLQEAFYLEVARCDPRKAIEVYRRVLEAKPLTDTQAARAHLRLGICLDVIGELQKSRQQFETLIRVFPGETEVAALARRRLENRRPADPALFMPDDVLVYAELVEPAKQVERLAGLLEGTPFQNPVDSRLSYLATLPEEDPGSPSEAPRPPAEVERAAAFLNQGFLDELRLVEGVAIGIPATGVPSRHYLAVFFPGASNVFRGLFRMIVAIEKPAAEGSVRDLPLYRFRDADADTDTDEETYLALGADVMVWGRPRHVVEEAVERYYSGGASLAGAAPFRASRPRGSGTLAFAFVGDRWVEALRGVTAERERPGFDALLETLRWNRFFPFSATLQHLDDADTLNLAIHTRTGSTEDAPLWDAVTSGAIDPDVLRVVPRASLGLAAVGFDRGDERWLALQEAASRLSTKLPADEARGLDEAITKLDPLLTSPAVNDFLAALDSIAVAFVPEFRSPRALLLVFKCVEPARGEDLLRAALTAASKAAFRTRASEDLRRSTLTVDGTGWNVHTLTPQPGLDFHFLRLGPVIALSPSLSTLEAAIHVSQGRQASCADLETRGASKVFFVRPPLLWKALDERDRPRQLQPLFDHIEQVQLFTHETEKLRIDIRIPHITGAVREILNKIGQSGQESR